MKKILVSVLLLLFAAAPAAAGNTDEVDDLLKGMEAFWAEVDTMVCNFTQKKRLPLFDAEIVSKGSFAYKRPGTMIWRYDPPEETVMAVKPGVVTIYFKENNRAKVIHLGKDENYPQAMTFGLGGTADQKGLKEKFDVALTKAGDKRTLTLIPKERGGGDRFEKIVITIRKDFTPISTVIHFSAEDVTAFDFKNVVINGPVDKKTFKLVLPKGVVVEEVGSGK
ncbi:MAG: outer membrane lipoprotein carrier protein LolA [Deltaproteobacteria bacterium]|uniref:Outer membrane lipoprotein carrier protein LolA n=1 Tax=Candidatus Zymogenus saltonus TaxID=2844893 RepID=A0A9D8PM96_9DELT|nr:outer membrane lipoprotein carrier protein LolA [Candidatus Zymogenus saltonus]